MPTPDIAKTRQTYDLLAPSWSTADEQKGGTFWLLELQKLKQLLPNGRILEIGMASGRDAEHLIGLGYAYTGVDNSAGMVKTAQQKHPDATFLQQDVLELDFPENTFAGFWAAAILLHVPKKDIDTALGHLHRVVRQGGVGLITLREGEGEGLREKVKNGLPDKRYFANYTAEEFTEVLKRNGFGIIEASRRDTGDQYVWLSFFVKVV